MPLLQFSPSGPVESGIKSFFFLVQQLDLNICSLHLLILELGHSKTGFQVSICLSGEQFSIHPLSIYLLKVTVGLELIPAVRGQRQGAPWTSGFLVFLLGWCRKTSTHLHIHTYRKFRVINDAALDVFDGGSQRTQREPKQAQREHANSEMLESESRKETFLLWCSSVKHFTTVHDTNIILENMHLLNV